MTVVQVDTWCEGVYCKHCDEIVPVVERPTHLLFCKNDGSYLGMRQSVSIHGGDALTYTRDAGKMHVSWKVP